jgi:regulation of enolase protein 1 (concanavalin A-like superfamily)
MQDDVVGKHGVRDRMRLYAEETKRKKKIENAEKFEVQKLDESTKNISRMDSPSRHAKPSLGIGDVGRIESPGVFGFEPQDDQKRKEKKAYMKTMKPGMALDTNDDDDDAAGSKSRPEHSRRPGTMRGQSFDEDNPPTQKVMDAEEKKAKCSLADLLDQDSRDSNKGKETFQLKSFSTLRDGYMGAIDSMRPELKPAHVHTKADRKEEAEKVKKYGDLKEAWDTYEDTAQDRPDPKDLTPEEEATEAKIVEIETAVNKDWQQYAREVVKAVQDNDGSDDDSEGDDEWDFWILEAKRLKAEADIKKAEEEAKRKAKEKAKRRKEKEEQRRRLMEEDGDIVEIAKQLKEAARKKKEDEQNAKGGGKSKSKDYDDDSDSDDETASKAKKGSKPRRGKKGRFDSESDDSDSDDAPTKKGKNGGKSGKGKKGRFDSDSDDSDSDDSPSRKGKNGGKSGKGKKGRFDSDSDDTDDSDDLASIKAKKKKKKADMDDAPKTPAKKKKNKIELTEDALPSPKTPRNQDGTLWKNPLNRWTNKPKKKIKEVNAQIIFKVPEKTDCWRKTRHNFIMDNAPYNWHKVTGDFEAIVKVSGDFGRMYDKAGIMVREDAENWILTGMEFFNKRVNHSTCVTRDFTDWSLSPLPEGSEKHGIWFCIKRVGNSYETFYSLDSKRWIQTRQGLFSDKAILKVGICCACPMGDEFKVVFDSFYLKKI